MTVHFENVGRSKLSWTANLSSVSDNVLVREIKQRKALMSSGIDLDWDDSGTRAAIIVGGFRVVGCLRIEDGVRLTIQSANAGQSQPVSTVEGSANITESKDGN